MNGGRANGNSKADGENGGGGGGGGAAGGKNSATAVGDGKQMNGSNSLSAARVGGYQMAAPPGSFQNDNIAGKYVGPDGKVVEIRNVWAHNLEEEMIKIRIIVEKFPYVAMDTEFPGVVARPIVDYNQSDYQYQTLRCNVDLLKIIQLGLCFSNEKGEFPEGCCCWQFNFKFSLDADMYAQDSIDLLKQSGINFEAHQTRGIEVQDFGELLMTSGLVLMDSVYWVSFHSGYDFGYLLKLLTCQPLPADESVFFELLHTYFPRLYDIKYMMTASDGFHGGLSKLGDDFKVDRIGQMHQAGSDSLLTDQVFYKMVELHFNGNVNCDAVRHFCGELYGYGANASQFRPKHLMSQSNGYTGPGANTSNGGGGGGSHSVVNTNANTHGLIMGSFAAGEVDEEEQ